MIRQVTAAKTRFRAGPGQEAAEGRETWDTAATEGSKQAYLLQLEEQVTATGSSAHFHTASSLGDKAAWSSQHTLLHEQGW